mgnify:CR=1 FL=1
MNEKLTVRQVVDQAVEAMLAMGQSPNTVWRAFYPRCTRLIRFANCKCKLDTRTVKIS